VAAATVFKGASRQPKPPSLNHALSWMREPLKRPSPARISPIILAHYLGSVPPAACELAAGENGRSRRAASHWHEIPEEKLHFLSQSY